MPNQPTGELLNTRPVFTGRVIQVNVETVRLPNGNVAELDMIHHPGGAAVVALNDENKICLLHQFRHAANGWLWELPAGKIDNREPPIETAHRELEEEAGKKAQHWQSLGDYCSSPGVFDEVVHLFLATGLNAVDIKQEGHEVIEIHWISLDEAIRMAHMGEIRDGKSIVGIFRAAMTLSALK